ncbi:MAG: purine-nucleoside phosphorylase [Candidatus Cloacimonetes bacterium]|nr:purine-nucleoside phosphorylase [Candidatus Cloacimonadota bacterium]
MNGACKQTADWLKQRLPEVPKVALILGTGLNGIAERGRILFQIPYGEIPGFASSTAPSHKGNLILGELGGTKVLYLQGRFHYYEGHPMSAVVFPTRVLASLGVQTLIVTNASGSLREELAPGSIVMLADHINFMGTNPLIGENDGELGERFPSLNEPYDPRYAETCAQIARHEGIPLNKGVYVAVTGPSLETRAECAAFASLGADLVGMSTVPEVIAARHAGMRVLAFSVVTNYSNLFHNEAHSQEEIRANADRASTQLIAIITAFLGGLD